MGKSKEYHVGWDGAKGIRVKAASFIGAMRAAFGPGEYRVADVLSEHQRRIKWCTLGAESFFIVSTQPDEKMPTRPFVVS